MCDTSHFGTRAYAPPEQFGYGQTDVRSDVYALGMLLFYLLCEETPVPATVQDRLCERGFPNRCATWWRRRRRSILSIGSGRWERCARRSCTRSGSPSIFDGEPLLLVRAARRVLAISGVAIPLPKRVACKDPDSSLVSEWMVLYGPATLGMLLMRISLTSRLVRQSPAFSATAPDTLTLCDAKERGRSKAFAHGVKAVFRWLWDFWSGIAHHLPLGVGVAWDILLAAWGVVMALACVASGMNPQGDTARLPAVACAVSYVCVWLVMGLADPVGSSTLGRWRSCSRCLNGLRSSNGRSAGAGRAWVSPSPSRADSAPVSA